MYRYFLYYSLSHKTVNTRENFWNVYCFTTNQMRAETARDNRQTALISHDLARNNELAFSSTRNLQFYRFQILKFCFLDVGFCKIDMDDILGKAMLKEDRMISRSDIARQSVWEREKMSQSQAMFLCLCFTCRSKGHASWLWLVVFDPYFFVAEKQPLPTTQTCTVVNFRFLYSLLGKFGSLVFEQPEFSD